jgi:hypothetical protein
VWNPPNLSDYVAFLQGVVQLPAANLPTATGTATGGDTASLTDSTATWTVNQWAGFTLTDTTQNAQAVVLSNTTTTLTFAALPNPINAGDTYWITQGFVPGSLWIAQQTVNTFLMCVAEYSLIVYNLAADRLINYAVDLPNQTYYEDVRKKFSINNVSLWVTDAASDHGTSQHGVVPEQLKMLTLMDLQTLRTPWGRTYMGMAQATGTLWGIS